MMPRVILGLDVDEFDSSPSRDNEARRGLVAVTAMVVSLVQGLLCRQRPFYFTGLRVQAEHREGFPIVHPRQVVDDKDIALVVVPPQTDRAGP